MTYVLSEQARELAGQITAAARDTTNSTVTGAVAILGTALNDQSGFRCCCALVELGLWSVDQYPPAAERELYGAAAFTTLSLLALEDPQEAAGYLAKARTHLALAQLHQQDVPAAIGAGGHHD